MTLKTQCDFYYSSNGCENSKHNFYSEISHLILYCKISYLLSINTLLAFVRQLDLLKNLVFVKYNE